LALDRAW